MKTLIKRVVVSSLMMAVLTSSTSAQSRTKAPAQSGKTSGPIVDSRKAVEIPAFVPDSVLGEIYDVIHDKRGVGLSNVKAEQWLHTGPTQDVLTLPVDGKKTTSIFEDYLTTGEGLTPGWTLDLGGIAYVDHIVISNSVAAQEFLKGRNFFIYTGSKDITFSSVREEKEPAAGNKKFWMKNVSGLSEKQSEMGPDVSEPPLGPYAWPTDKESFIVPIKRSVKKISISLQKDGVLTSPLTRDKVVLNGVVYK